MRRQHRWAMTGGALLLAAALTTACSPEPAPTPTPTGFASEEEAFEAAEATYRAYVDALNERRVDTDSLPDPTDFLTGDAYNDEVDLNRDLAEENLHVVGNTRVSSSHAIDSSDKEIRMTFCVDASDTRVIDSSDRDVTPRDRTEHLGVDVTFAITNRQLQITNSTTSERSCSPPSS